jgi:hypothetical protein
MTATTARMTVNGQAIFASEVDIAKINEALRDMPVSSEQYINGKYVYAPTDKRMQLVPTLTIDNVIS